jgi:hypothetical protein
MVASVALTSFTYVPQFPRPSIPSLNSPRPSIPLTLPEKLMLSLRSNMLFRMGGMEMSLSTWESGTVVSEILLEKQNVSCIIR